MAIRGDVYVGGTNELNHLLGTDEAVVEDYLRFHSYFLRQGLQTGSILVSLATQDVRMGRTCDDVGNVLVLGENSRQSLNYVFDSLVRREQSEREQNRFPFYAKAVLVEIRIQERQIWNSMRYHVDLAAWHFEDFLQELGRQLAHDNEPVGEIRDLLHDQHLVWIWLAQNGVQRGYHRHFQTA